ncbi:hypothetical protein [Jeotgalibaca porci]|uniref:phage tail protein n=1 Tax=Jeotgalibaca porci TaxID=1868793 RepID=UPI0035A03A70
MADFNIMAIIGANVKNFKDGMSEAKGALADFKKEAGKTMAEVGDALAKGGKAMTAGITLPIVAGVAGAIKSFADLEQVVGGIEKLFGNSANAVIRNSESAYKRAGVSGVDYMEQVTSFSATLLAGLEGDTVKAAEYADKAIVDMSDNAATFGTSIGDIQNAYQGFAKDNYTMLDNLKLGFGGTAGEMARLVNESGVMGDSFEATAENVKDIPFDQLIEAIHVVQTEMGITGTTAKEASETVSGSFDAMKAAFQNLAAGFGDSNADIELLMQNLWETVQTFASNINGVLETMWDNLPLEDWQKWLGVIVVSIGPVMLALSGLIKGVETVIGTFKLLGTVFSLLTSPIGLIIVAIGLFVGALVYLWTTNEEFRNKVIEIWNAILDFLLPIVETIKTFIMDTWNNLSAWWTENQEGIKNTIMNAWNSITEFLMPIVQAIADFIKETWEVISAWWSENQEAMKATVDTVWNAIKSIFDSVVTLITGIVEAGLEQIRQFWDRWGTVITTIVRVAWAFIESIFSNRLNNILSIVSGVINQIKIIFQFAMDFIKNLVNTVLALIRGDWEGVLNGIKGMASAFGTFIGDTFRNMMNTAKNLVSNGINAVKGFFNQLWNIDLAGAGRAIIDGFLGGLKSAFENVKNFVGGIASWISKNKGPISYDKKLLIEHGQSIMQGLDRGLTDKFKDVKRNVSSMAGSIADAVTDASAMGNNLNNALASSVGGNYNMTANGQLTINQQPAYINLDLGGRSYRAFVEDISNAQSQNVRFEESYSL